MNERIDPFNPSPAEVKATVAALGVRLLESKGPEDLIPISAGELVVMLRESAVLRERITELEKTVTAALAVSDTWARKYAEQTEELDGAYEILRNIKESYEARSELFTSDADCAANLAAWAIKGLGAITVDKVACERPRQTTLYMIPLTITQNIERQPWPDVKEVGAITRIGRLPRGTSSGKSSVSISIDLADGTRVTGQTTMALFQQAAKLLRIADEENL